MADVDDVLEHFGVKGQKWGVRKDDSGGHTISEDARKANRAAKTAKKEGTDVLSNEDLQRLVTRMNLEKQYKTLSPATGSQKAGKFVADLLLTTGKQQAAKLINDQAAKQLAKVLASK